jgi:hypothetical protein
VTALLGFEQRTLLDDLNAIKSQLFGDTNTSMVNMKLFISQSYPGSVSSGLGKRMTWLGVY